jgi:hypothetical protein
MAKASGNFVSVENWTLNRGTDQEKLIVKIAVRQSDGKFLGATNFRQK